MSNLGEIARLSRTTCPNVGVVTNIGVSHLETLLTRENILRAKLEILEGMPKGSPLILNLDNDLLSTVISKEYPILTYGIHNSAAQFFGTEIQESGSSTTFALQEASGKRTQVTIPCIGSHNVLNALAAFAVGLEAGLEREQIAQALLRYEPSGMRQRIVQCRGITIIEDCYNASPDSMAAALSILAGLKVHGKRIAVLGDMLELGDLSQKAHEDLGRLAVEKGADLLLCFGEQCRFTVESARKAGLSDAWHFESKESLCLKLLKAAQPGDLILCKGSRSMAMEQVLQHFYSQQI